MTHEPPAVHGMLIFGETKIFLSHLPMFHPPHDYQLVLEVSLYETGGDPAAAYREDRRRSGERVYTWVPKPFSLPTLLGDPGGATEIEGTIFRGHFERGGVPITSDKVAAHVTRVLHGRKFTPAEDRPQRLTYLVFGGTDERFAAHWISGPPDFDQILSVSGPRIPVNSDGAVLLVEMHDRPNTLDTRLREGEDAVGTTLSDGRAVDVRFTLGDEFYLETEDLAH